MYKWNYRIRYSECDPAGRLGMSGVLALFQDVGYRHAEESGRGVAFTERTGTTYYLLSWQIEIYRAPCVGEEVVLSTWFSSERASLAEKSIEMRAPSGELLAAGGTRWVFMNVREKAPALPPAGLWERETLLPPAKLASAPRRIRLLADAVSGAPFSVLYRDTDTNRHVNNVRFVHLAASAAKVELDRTRSLSVEYLHEAHEGETLVPRICRTESETTVSLDRGDTPCARFAFLL